MEGRGRGVLQCCAAAFCVTCVHNKFNLFFKCILSTGITSLDLSVLSIVSVVAAVPGVLCNKSNVFFSASFRQASTSLGLSVLSIVAGPCMLSVRGVPCRRFPNVAGQLFTAPHAQLPT